MTEFYYCTAHTQDRILDEVRKCRELGKGNVCSWTRRYCSALKQYEETSSRRPISLTRTDESLAIEAE
jgi:hypothetical protein